MPATDWSNFPFVERGHEPTIKGSHVMVCDVGKWSGPPPVEYHYQWQVGRNGIFRNALGNSTSPIFEPVDAEQGYEIRVIVTAFTQDGSSTSCPSDVAGEVISE